MLETDRKCNWSEIKIGEVFVAQFYNGDYVIEVKQKKTLGINNNSFCLSGKSGVCDFSGEYNTWSGSHGLYKLSESIQRLWKEE